MNLDDFFIVVCMSFHKDCDFHKNMFPNLYALRNFNKLKKCMLVKFSLKISKDGKS